MIALGMGMAIRVTMSLECRVCRQALDAERIDHDTIDVAFCGAVAFAQCPSCRQTVGDFNDPNYRARVRRFEKRRKQAENRAEK